METATAAPPPGRDAPALAPRAGAALAAGATLLLTAACDPGRPAAPAARPSPSPAYSSAGGPVVLQRVAVGQYRADFHKLGRTPDAAGTGAHGTEVALRNSSGGAVRVARAGVGAYAVRFEGLQRPNPLRREHVQLTAFGPGFSSCSLDGVRDDPSSTPAALVVDVRCTDQHGQLADSRFNVMVIE